MNSDLKDRFGMEKYIWESLEFFKWGAGDAA
jgi:hypothetical protein